MRGVLGLEVVTTEVDTDSLGTFDGDVPRVGSPWDAATAKARLGMVESGRPLGLATEGTFGPSDASPFVTADVELVVLVDDELGIVIGETAVEFAPPAVALDVRPGDLDVEVLRRAGFPEHGLIVRPSGRSTTIVKGIHDERTLFDAIDRCAALSVCGTARVESDFRAHHHPRRRQVIARAAERLASRLAALCPTCAAPGWGVSRREAGAACSWCGRATRLTAVEHWACPACAYGERHDVGPVGGVDPAHCQTCNP